MGYSRRKEARELVEVIEESDARIQGVTLGQLCAAGTVWYSLWLVIAARAVAGTGSLD